MAGAAERVRKGLRRGAATGAIALSLAAAVLCAATPSSAKTPGATHCYGKTCHRVSTLEEMDGIVGRTGLLKASFYDDCRNDRFNACGLTSSGAVFRPDLADNAASPIFPDGTVLLAYNPANRKAAVLRVNSAGPYWGDRKLDVSRAAAEKLGFRDKGIAELMVAVVKSPEAAEARYRKMRRYASVPGYIGAYPTFHDAHAAALAKLELEFEAPPTQYADVGPEELERAGPKVDKKELFEHAIIYVDAREPDVVSPAPLHIEEARTVTSVEPAGSFAAAGALTPQSPPLSAVIAEEPDYSWEGWRRYAVTFVASAIHRARAHAPPPEFPPAELWTEKLVRFVWRARQQAREGGTRRSPFSGLFADLMLKAQAQR